MFTLYHSNQVDLLKTLMSELIRLEPLANPLEAEVILVQSPGMSQWLKLSMASEQGIAANIEFPLPATFIWRLFEKVLPDVPSKSAFNKESMTWRLNELLPHYLSHSDFAPLAQYLADDDKLKQLQLAEKIADVFDGYLVYRPDWIAAWEAGQDVEEIGEEQQWQPILWRALYDHTVASGESPYHRANLYDEFIDTLSHYHGEISGLPKRLFVFGISSLPPRYLEALHAIGQHIDVHFMFTNPCRYYWGDVRDQKTIARMAAQSRRQIEWHGDHSEEVGSEALLKGSVEQNIEDEAHLAQVGNSLLASLGKLGRDNLQLLSQLECQEVDAFVDLPRETLLSRIQSDILELDERSHQPQNTLNPKQIVSSDDHSLTIHSCHSATREVEVLHDHLLRLFQQDPSLNPRDVIVMVPDINAYTPAIEAIFGHGVDSRTIPYSISDRTTTEANPVLNAFFALIGLSKTRAPASLILELLETPAILRRFGLSLSDFEAIKRWVEEVGIRWGLTAQTGHNLGFEQVPLNTWQFGLQRMLMGYAMHPDTGLYQSDDTVIAPFNGIQGMQADVAGRLAEFIDGLIEFQSKLTGTYTIEQWQQLINQLLDGFFSAELDDEMMLSAIRESVTQLKKPLSELTTDTLLDSELVLYCLKQKLSQSRVSQRFLAGQVNFCTLMPMRSIPFKVVCLMGMNDGVYPPAELVEGFDLMQNRARAGDRSRRIDGRYMFLEAMLSAQQSLYISYVGRSIKDNGALEPSILVSELSEYCQHNYSLEHASELDDEQSAAMLKQHLFSEHSMTPYSASQFSGEAPSFAAEWLPVAQSGDQPIDSTESDWNLPSVMDELSWPVELELDSLRRFWTLPVKRFMNQRLGVYFDPFQPSMIDEEPFAMGGLGSFNLRQELLENALEASIASGQVQMNTKPFLKQKRAQGVLPVGAFGELDILQSEQQTQQLLETLLPHCQSPIPAQAIEVSLAPWDDHRRVVVQGWFDSLYTISDSQHRLLRYRSGQLRAKYLLGYWIEHLLLCASGKSVFTTMIGMAKEGAVEWSFVPLECEQAKVWLNQLLKGYFEGLDQPLAFFIDSYWEGAVVVEKAKQMDAPLTSDSALFEKVIKKVESTFTGSSFRAGESQDPHIKRVWPNWDESLNDSAMNAINEILLPLMKSLEKTAS